MTKKRTPPRLACWLLRLRLSRAHYECIAGDLTEEYNAGGHTASWFWKQAVSVVRVPFGEVEFGEQRGFHAMQFLADFWQDVQYAGRTLLRNPSFAIVAVLAVAFGIGVNT